MPYFAISDHIYSGYLSWIKIKVDRVSSWIFAPFSDRPEKMLILARCRTQLHITGVTAGVTAGETAAVAPRPTGQLYHEKISFTIEIYNLYFWKFGQWLYLDTAAVRSVLVNSDWFSSELPYLSHFLSRCHPGLHLFSLPRFPFTAWLKESFNLLSYVASRLNCSGSSTDFTN